MSKDGKKVDATIFLTLSGGGLAEALYVCNAEEAIRMHAHLFCPLPFTVYIHMRPGTFPAFRIMGNEDLINRFNKSLITATIELTKDDVPYLVSTKGSRFKHHMELRVDEAEPYVALPSSVSASAPDWAKMEKKGWLAKGR